ncbi:CPBP family intramembrane glutamic endopeptidase [Fictibacillus terranigra]|uniref:Type II CAAX endopeptidase family protein n=1 Tax=Fictibacillus terranigra TaxID=3058424 RepID=A0ABT8E9Q4_9BACL|nr:type II CAAX endopeptidase family protein [Fictibacillus sp. CENA-BCM004]MDN4074599.1 type II CAAX endopeptidase family protein [Fictibacillus sp. CENA-BCM004]
MKNWDQAQLIRQMSDRELRINIYFSQFLFFTAGIAVMWFTHFDLTRLRWESFNIIVFGAGTAIGVVLINLLLHKWLPKGSLDDGGINVRIFRSMPVWHIAVLTAVISFSEEWLFRGAVQPLLGLSLTSLLFAVLHVRYIKKPVLFTAAVLLSFLLGYLYEYTGNLLVPMTAHFFIDFLLGLLISKGWLSAHIESYPLEDNGGGTHEEHE